MVLRFDNMKESIWIRWTCVTITLSSS